MIQICMGKGKPITIDKKEYFVEEENLKDFILNTDFNEHDFLTFRSIDIWEP